MTKVIPGPEADVAGYMVFKLGAAGVILGLCYGAAFGGSDALLTWLEYTLAVAVTGAFLGSLTWLGKVKRRAERPELPEIAPLAKTRAPDGAAPAEPVAARRDGAARPRVSAFRAQPKAIH